jgi:Fe-S-cluster-containing dehydrogenase component
MTGGKDLKKVFIDLDLLDRLEEEKDLGIECSYPYHPKNEGVTTLRELASYAVICRKCEEASCVLSCPKEALEKDDEGILRRYNMRCVSCKSCAVACPFGTIYPLAIPYTVSRCDFCTDRLSPGEDPLCVRTSPDNVIEYIDVSPDETKGIYQVGDHLVVKCKAWKR